MTASISYRYQAFEEEYLLGKFIDTLNDFSRIYWIWKYKLGPIWSIGKHRLKEIIEFFRKAGDTARRAANPPPRSRETANDRLQADTR